MIIWILWIYNYFKKIDYLWVKDTMYLWKFKILFHRKFYSKIPSCTIVIIMGIIRWFISAGHNNKSHSAFTLILDPLFFGFSLKSVKSRINAHKTNFFINFQNLTNLPSFNNLKNKIKQLYMPKDGQKVIMPKILFVLKLKMEILRNKMAA